MICARRCLLFVGFNFASFFSLSFAGTAVMDGSHGFSPSASPSLRNGLLYTVIHFTSHYG